MCPIAAQCLPSAGSLQANASRSDGGMDRRQRLPFCFCFPPQRHKSDTTVQVWIDGVAAITFAVQRWQLFIDLDSTMQLPVDWSAIGVANEKREKATGFCELPFIAALALAIHRPEFGPSTPSFTSSQRSSSGRSPSTAISCRAKRQRSCAVPYGNDSSNRKIGASVSG